jgi:hypothetical protein
MAVFHYFSGEAVELGDKVSDAGHIGFVTDIFQPGSQEAADFSCPEEGGIFVVSDWNGQKSNILWTPPDGKSWEDLEFLERKQKA